jgi:hypothetical protein
MKAERGWLLVKVPTSLFGSGVPKRNVGHAFMKLYSICSLVLDWIEAQRLSYPECIEGNERLEIIITAIHWLPMHEDPCSLVVSYQNHGVQ